MPADPTVSDGGFQPIDQIPSHSSPPSDGLVYVTCDRQPYRVVADIYEGRRVRAAFEVSDDRDLWRVVPGADDVKVEEDHELAFVTSGGRFFTAPKFINGSGPTVSDGATFEEIDIDRLRSMPSCDSMHHRLLNEIEVDRALIEAKEAEINRLRMEMAELIVNASPATVYKLQDELDALTNERQRQEDRWAIVAGRIAEIRRLLRTTSTGYLIVDDNQWANLLFDAGLEDRAAWREARDGALSEPAVEEES